MPCQRGCLFVQTRNASGKIGLTPKCDVVRTNLESYTNEKHELQPYDTKNLVFDSQCKPTLSYAGLKWIRFYRGGWDRLKCSTSLQLKVSYIIGDHLRKKYFVLGSQTFY